MAKQNGPNIMAILREVINECKVCKRYKKTPPRPRIAMSKANTANKVVSLDLSEFRNKNKYVLYMCNEFSAYMKVKVIKDKKPSTIIKAFNNVWIEDGPGIQSKGTMTDNGGEFRNEDFKEMASKYGIKISVTAGNSSWLN